MLFWIALGGAIGATGRFAVSTWSNDRFRHSPIGTFIVNISGAFVLGLLAGLADVHIDPSTDAYRLMTVGILGSYTTFSTLSYETFILIETERRVVAASYALGSLITGLTAVFLGVGAAGLW